MLGPGKKLLQLVFIEDLLSSEHGARTGNDNFHTRGACVSVSIYIFILTLQLTLQGRAIISMLQLSKLGPLRESHLPRVTLKYKEELGFKSRPTCPQGQGHTYRHTHQHYDNREQPSTLMYKSPSPGLSTSKTNPMRWGCHKAHFTDGETKLQGVAL